MMQIFKITPLFSTANNPHIKNIPAENEQVKIAFIFFNPHFFHVLIDAKANKIPIKMGNE